MWAGSNLLVSSPQFSTKEDSEIKTLWPRQMSRWRTAKLIAENASEVMRTEKDRSGLIQDKAPHGLEVR